MSLSKTPLYPKTRQYQHQAVDHPPHKRHPRAHLVVPRIIHRAHHQPDNTPRQQRLHARHRQIHQRDNPHQSHRLADRVLAEEFPVLGREFGEACSVAGVGGGAQVRAAETHENGVERDEEVRGADGEEGPVEREAPDGGQGVEVLGCAEEGADGPVEAGEGGSGVGEGGWWGCVGTFRRVWEGERNDDGRGLGKGGVGEWMVCAISDVDALCEIWRGTGGCAGRS